MLLFKVVCVLNGIVAYLFLGVATVTMTLWAQKRHRAYKKEFGAAYPKGRRMIFPFIY